MVPQTSVLSPSLHPQLLTAPWGRGATAEHEPCGLEQAPLLSQPIGKVVAIIPISQSPTEDPVPWKH